MHNASVVRRTFLSALAALTLLAGALFVAAPKASAAKSECPENAVCVWQNTNFTGIFSWWPASNTGCHNHSSNPNLRSGWNRTGVNVRFGGRGTFGPNTSFQIGGGEPPLTGEICWPV
jgi:Peptidase inhibitor family I36